MLEATRRTGATILGHHFHRFTPHGVSGVVVLAESHFAIHTWPEHGYAALDLFTCGRTLTPDACLPYLVEALGSGRQTTRRISRGGEGPGEQVAAATSVVRAWPHLHRESVGPGRVLALRMTRPWLFDGVETFPELGGMQVRTQIGEFAEFGRGLVMDGQVQLAEATDAVYTSALVFPAALASRSRADWLIVGGGDGAAVREALRFRDCVSVRLIDISAEVIARTQALIPSFWAGAQADPRLTIERRDAWTALRERVAAGQQADIVVFDLTDPQDEEHRPFPEVSAGHLYTAEAFALAARSLKPGGVFVAQTQELSSLRWQAHARLRGLVHAAFRWAYSYRVYVESFGCWQSFIVASNEPGAWSPVPDEAAMPTLERVYDGDARAFWSSEWHRSLFVLPPDVRRALSDPLRS